MLDIYRRLVIKHLDMEAGNLFLNDIQIREFSNSRIDLPLLYFVGQYNDIDIFTNLYWLFLKKRLNTDISVCQCTSNLGQYSGLIRRP